MRVFKHLAAFCFILLAVEAADACSCLRSGSACDYYGATEAIFLGRVVGSAERKSHVDEHGNKTVYDVGTIRFLVQENFKGAPGYEIEITSGTGGGDCGYWFIREQSYLVYAYRSPADNKLHTNICTRTAPVSRASEDLEYLRGREQAKPGGTLYGNVQRLIGDPEHGPVEEGPKMAGVKVLVTGEGRTIETVTNGKGDYRVTGLPPGDYDAFPQLPSNLGAVSNRDQQDDLGRFARRERVRLVDRACGELSFTVRFNGVVSGKVTQADGEPAKEVEVTLTVGDDADKEWWTWTDKDGNYEFSMVQPGSYLLGFNLNWAPDRSDPYPRTYYPGVKTRSEASLITIGEGEKLKGHDLTLPPRLKERPLTVTVVGRDGKPLANVEVNYLVNEAKSMNERALTNEKGQAVLKLYDNQYYIIHAAAGWNINQPVYAMPIEVFVDNNLKPIRLVVSKDGYAYDSVDALKRTVPPK